MHHSENSLFRALLALVCITLATSASERGFCADAQDKQSAAPADAKTEPKAVLSGRIVDDTGAPVTDAELQIFPSGGGRVLTARTDKDGRYAFSAVTQSGEYRILIRSTLWVGFSRSNQSPTIRLDDKTPTERNFELKRAAALRIQTVDEKGLPLSRVRLYAGSLTDERFRAPEGASTDASGWTTIGGLEPSTTPYLIAAMPQGNAAHGFAKLEITLDKAGDEVSRKLVVPKGVDVKASAVCSDGNPPGGWRIVAMPSWWRFGVSPQGEIVEPDGTFTLRNIVPGEYDLNLSIPTGNGTSTSRPILAGAKLTEMKQPIKFKIDYPSPESMTFISGRLSFKSGQPKQGFWIHARSEDGKHTGEAYLQAGQTEFRIDPIPRGKYRISFQSREIEPKTLEDVEAPSDNLEVELSMQRPLTLKGTVLRGDTGSPATEFRLRVLKSRTLRGPNYAGDNEWHDYKHPQGKFEVPVLGPGIYSVWASSEDYAVAHSDTINTDTDLDKSIEIRLSKGVSLAGMVVDPDGHPVNDAKVMLSEARATGRMEGRYGRFTAQSRFVTTDKGRFVIDNLLPGQDVLKVVHPDFAPEIVKHVEIRADGDQPPLQIALKSGATVTGHVYDADGNPEPSVTLLFQDGSVHVGDPRSEEGRLATVVTDRDGRYEVPHLPEVQCDVFRQEEWEGPGVTRTTILPANGTTVPLDLGGTSRVTGRLLLNGQPAANAKLLIADESPYFGTFRALGNTDGNGDFVFRGLALGGRTLYYSLESHPRNWTPVRILQITAGDLDLGTLEHFEGKVTIYCRTASLRPPNKTERMLLSSYDPVWAYRQQVGELKTPQEAGEPYVFEKVPVGEYEILYYPSGTNAVRKTVEVSRDRLESEVTLNPPEGTASLRCKIEQGVLGPEGTFPSVTLWSKDRRISASLIANEDGEFVAEKLPAGEYALTTQSVRQFDAIAKFTVEEGESKTVEITSENVLKQTRPRGFLQVRVFTPEGIPLPGCDIQIEGTGGELSPNSSQRGVVSFSGEPGTYQLTVSYPGFEPVRQSIEMKSTNESGGYDESHQLQIRLKPAAK